MSPIKICLVEDLQEVREGMASLVAADERFEMVCSFNDAETAAEELPSLQPDIVIMDINLPGMNGIDCIRKVKKLCPNTQFMMFTIYEDDEKVFEALKAGASGYLLKKSPLEKITASLIELYEGGSPMSTQIARKVIKQFHRPEAGEEVESLSDREQEILHLLGQGLLYKEIASRLNITTGTVKQHVHKIYSKMHVSNRMEAVNKFSRK